MIDPADYGAPDPADFADPDDGLSALLTEIDGLKKGKETRDGDQILTTSPARSRARGQGDHPERRGRPDLRRPRSGVDENGLRRPVKVTGTFFSGATTSPTT